MTSTARGEWVIDISQGSMTCGYCGQTVRWQEAFCGVAYVTLTGFHLLGIHTPTGRLDVLAEAMTRSGKITYLPHECAQISAQDRAKYAPQRITLTASQPGRAAS